MTSANNFEVTETLRNGLAVRIRAIRPADRVGVVEAFGKLDPESVYTRFFQAKKSLSDQELKAATEVDFENVVALVVTIESGGNETIIGGGRYSTFDLPSGRSAEIAFVVEEDYHGQGIASRLLKHLLLIAGEQGISRFEADVLHGNKKMLKVFERAGLPVVTKAFSDSIHVTIFLHKGEAP